LASSPCSCWSLWARQRRLARTENVGRSPVVAVVCAAVVHRGFILSWELGKQTQREQSVMCSNSSRSPSWFTGPLRSCCYGCRTRYSCRECAGKRSDRGGRGNRHGYKYCLYSYCRVPLPAFPGASIAVWPSNASSWLGGLSPGERNREKLSAMTRSGAMSPYPGSLTSSECSPSGVRETQRAERAVASVGYIRARTTPSGGDREEDPPRVGKDARARGRCGFPTSHWSATNYVNVAAVLGRVKNVEDCAECGHDLR
jgi:hypothetical protein